MGLDAWVRAVSRRAVDFTESGQIKEIDEDIREHELAYWRGDHDLQEYMRQLHCKKYGEISPGDYNCVKTILTLDDVREYLKIVKKRRFNKTPNDCWMQATNIYNLTEIITYMEDENNKNKIVYYNSWW